MRADQSYKEALHAGIQSRHLILAEFLCRKYKITGDIRIFIFIAAVSMLFENGHLRIKIDTIAEDIALIALAGYEKGSLMCDYILKNLGDYKKLPDRYPFLFLNENEAAGEKRAPFILVDNSRYISTEKLYCEEQRFIKNLHSFISGEKINILPVDAVHRLIIKGIADIKLEKKQLEAVEITFRKKLSIIAGGPGTGKTTAVISIIKACLTAAAESGKHVNIAIAAPTGRAVKRIEDLLDANMLTEKVDRPKTLHRLLKAGSSAKTVILPHTMVIVDECSMVDIIMMNRLFSSINPDCSLVLVGDPDQLPSVGAGSVFADMLAEIEKPEHILNNCFIRLDTIKRSDREISDFAEKIRNGEAGKAAEGNSRVCIRPLSEDDVLDAVTQMYKNSGPGREDLINDINSFAVLTPTNSGPFGMMTLNRKISHYFSNGKKLLYDNMPVMITKNDYENDLFNGERGIVFSENNLFYFMFRKGEGSYKILPAAALKEWEVSYVQTIHKSQGNEFNRVIIIIDSFAERILTREILYTAVTRAKDSIIIFSDSDIINKAVKNKVVRNSGISRLMLN